MPCDPIVADGRVVGFICHPGNYSHLVMASCPWCCLGEDRTMHAFREVYGGWCAPDMICGTCGQKWTADDDSLRKMREDERLEGIGWVAQMKAAGLEVGPVPMPTALEECP